MVAIRQSESTPIVERWLGDAGSYCGALLRRAFDPFGLGDSNDKGSGSIFGLPIIPGFPFALPTPTSTKKTTSTPTPTPTPTSTPKATPTPDPPAQHETTAPAAVTPDAPAAPPTTVNKAPDPGPTAGSGGGGNSTPQAQQPPVTQQPGAPTPVPTPNGGRGGDSPPGGSSGSGGGGNGNGNGNGNSNADVAPAGTGLPSSAGPVAGLGTGDPPGVVPSYESMILSVNSAGQTVTMTTRYPAGTGAPGTVAAGAASSEGSWRAGFATATTTPKPGSTSGVSGSSTGSSSSSSSTSENKTGLIAGVVIGVVALLALLAFLLFRFRRSRSLGSTTNPVAQIKEKARGGGRNEPASPTGSISSLLGPAGETGADRGPISPAAAAYGSSTEKTALVTAATAAAVVTRPSPTASRPSTGHSRRTPSRGSYSTMPPLTVTPTIKPPTPIRSPASPPVMTQHSTSSSSSLAAAVLPPSHASRSLFPVPAATRRNAPSNASALSPTSPTNSVYASQNSNHNTGIPNPNHTSHPSQSSPVTESEAPEASPHRSSFSSIASSGILSPSSMQWPVPPQTPPVSVAAPSEDGSPVSAMHLPRCAGRGLGAQVRPSPLSSSGGTFHQVGNASVVRIPIRRNAA